MNIFVLDEDPKKAAEMMCDKHIPKMVVESAQMMASALRRHGATDEDFIEHDILTKKGTPYKGGYSNHPCTKWAGDSFENFNWLTKHAICLSIEYTKRYGKTHACENPIIFMISLWEKIPKSKMTPFAQAMPDKYRDSDVVKAYRAYYHSKTFAKWDKGTSTPTWFKEGIK